jgi:flavin-dependent dehydrogenase
MKDYITLLGLRNGECLHEQISTLAMNVYQSETCVKLYHDRIILLVGDSESALVLEQGFNKGIKTAVVCAKAVTDFLKLQDSQPHKYRKLPQNFEDYQNHARTIFSNELKKAKRKNNALRIAESSVQMTNSSLETSNAALETSSETSADLLETSSDFSSVISSSLNKFKNMFKGSSTSSDL